MLGLFYNAPLKILQTFDLSIFLIKFFFSGDGFQNMFVYQPTFNMLELREDKGTVYVIGWKWKGVYISKLILFHATFLLNINVLDTK